MISSEITLTHMSLLSDTFKNNPIFRLNAGLSASIIMKECVLNTVMIFIHLSIQIGILKLQAK